MRISLDIDGRKFLVQPAPPGMAISHATAASSVGTTDDLSAGACGLSADSGEHGQGSRDDLFARAAAIGALNAGAAPPEHGGDTAHSPRTFIGASLGEAGAQDIAAGSAPTN